MKGLEFAVLDIAHIWSDKCWNVAMNTIATKSNPNPKHEFAWAPIMSILVKHPDAGYLLFDTGFSETNVRTRTPFQLEHFHLEAETICYVDQRLEELGLTVNDISGIILSHLHWDHADGLELFCGTTAIKNVYVQKTELKEALLYTHGAGPKNPGDPIYSKRILDMDEIEYQFIDEDTEIFARDKASLEKEREALENARQKQQEEKENEKRNLKASALMMMYGKKEV